MRRWLFAVAAALTLAFPVISSGAEFLLLTELAKVRLVDIRSNKAIVRSPGGYTEAVEVGDRVGRERGEVVEVGGSYIIIERDKLRIKLPLGIRVER